MAASVYENHIKDFMFNVFSKLESPRVANIQVQGQNPNISKFQAWYNGDTTWHKKKVIRDGKKTNVKIKQSGFAKVVCEAWASSYANEDTEICIEKEKDNEIINEIFKYNNLFGRWNKFVERFMALSIGAMVQMPKKFTVSENTGELVTDTDNKVKIYFINANRVFPITIEDDQVTECGFLRVATNKIYLQIHVLGDDGNYIVAEVEADNKNENFSFDYNTAKVWMTSTQEPLFQIWHPNIVDNKDIDNELGTSCFGNSIDWLKSFDQVFDGFYTEFKNGRKKRFISADLEYIDSAGKHSVELEEDDVFIPKSVDGNNMLNEFNGALRVEAYQKALTVIANIIGKQAGLGDSKFKFDAESGRPIQTATGIIASEKDAYTNIIKAENFATMNFKKMCAAIKYIYNECIANVLTFNPEKDVKVVYDDNILEDTASKKDAELKEVQTGTLSIAEFRSHWYGESVDEAKQFVQENGLLLDKYTLALQAKVITPLMFVEFVFGENYKYKNELVAYIQENNKPVEMPTGFEDESDNDKSEDDGGRDDE
jgi:A118 family predicted phage portal protein